MTLKKYATSKLSIRKSGLKKKAGKTYGSHWIYIPTKLIKDSSFPFKVDDSLKIEIEGDNLIIKKNKRYYDKIIDYGIRNATLPKLIESKAIKNDIKPFLFFQDESYSYGEVNKISNKYAHGIIKLLRQLNLAKCNIALMLPNIPQYLFFWFGIIKASCVFVPINKFLKLDDLVTVIDHSESEILIIHYDYWKNKKSIKNLIPKVKKIIIINAPKDFNYSEEFVSFLDFISENDTNPESKIRNTSNMEIFYPSKEIAIPRGILLKHFMVFSGLISAEIVKEVGPHTKGTFYVPLPLYHAEIRLLVILTSMFLDLSIVIAEEFDPLKFWDDIIKYKVCCFYFLGNVLSLLINQPPRQNDRNHSLKWIFGPEVPADIWRIFENRFGVELFNTWNFKECIPFAVNKEGSKGNKIASKGRPLEEIFEVKIVDNHGKILPPGSENIGEILIRLTIPLSLSYYKKGIEEVDYFNSEGLAYTGELGFIDKEGYIYYAGRKEDLILRGTEVINTYEIEKIINKHPFVYESAVFEVFSEKDKQTDLKISIVLRKDGIIDFETFYDYLRENLAYFMVPRYIEFKKQLRNDITEYINKHNLIEEWKSEINKKKTWDAKIRDFILK